jgi:hypothetical protein
MNKIVRWFFPLYLFSYLTYLSSGMSSIFQAFEVNNMPLIKMFN